MKRDVLISAVFGLVITLVVAGAMMTRLAQAEEAGPEATLGTAFTYQGRLDDDGSPVTASCDMAFRLHDQAAAGSQVGQAITATVPITDGLFTASLDFGSGPFDGDSLWLGVLVNCPGDGSWTDLGRQELTAVPYALYALGVPWTGISDRPSGLDDGDDIGIALENVIIVAQSGGDYTTIQAAIDSIDDASGENPYLVWVAPGMYDELVSLKPHVHLQGAGQDATVIETKAGSDGSYPSVATLELAARVSVRDLTVRTVGAYNRNAAIRASSGVTRTTLADITVEAIGPMTNNYGVYLSGYGIDVTLRHATVLAQDSSNTSYALYCGTGAAVSLRGGTFTARDAGGAAYAIYSVSAGTKLDAEGVTAVAEDSAANMALHNASGSAAVLRGGLFRVRGVSAWAIRNQSSDASLHATGVTAIAENETTTSYPIGLRNTNSADAVVQGGSFTARGGGDAYGIYNADADTTLVAEGVTAIGRDSDGDCFGIYHRDDATATLSSGTYMGIGGTTATGIRFAAGALEAVAVTAVGDGATTTYGLNTSIGSVGTVSQSRLEGATNSVSGGVITLTNSILIGAASGDVRCLLVARNGSVSSDTSPYTCP